MRGQLELLTAFGGESRDMTWTWFEDESCRAVFDSGFWVNGQDLAHLAHELFAKVSDALCSCWVVRAELHLQSGPGDVASVGLLKVAQAMG